MKSKKVKSNWLKETKKDLRELNVTEDFIRIIGAFGTLLAQQQFADETKTKTSKQWTEEHNKQHSECIRRKKQETIRPNNKFKRAFYTEKEKA